MNNTRQILLRNQIWTKKNKMSLSFKILLIGDANTGKSTLSSRYVDDTYTSQYITTKGFVKCLVIQKVQTDN